MTRHYVRISDNPLENLAANDAAILVYFPYETDLEDYKVIAVWMSFKQLLEITGVLKISSDQYIPTIAGDLQAKAGERFQVVESGNLILPHDAPDGSVVRVADFNRRLVDCDYYVLATNGQTIAKGQVKDASKVTSAINLRHLEGYETFDFVKYDATGNWGLQVNGIARRIVSGAFADRPYIYTVAGDLKITPYAMVGIDKPGNIVLWQPSEVGEYATITDGRKLLANQDVYVVAPDGHLLGVDVAPTDKISTTINLRNPRGANWFRAAYLGDQKWEINWLTKN